MLSVFQDTVNLMVLIFVDDTPVSEYFRNSDPHYFTYHYININQQKVHIVDIQRQNKCVPASMSWCLFGSVVYLQPEPATEPPSALVPFLQKYADVSSKKPSVSSSPHSLLTDWSLIVLPVFISLSAFIQYFWNISCIEENLPVFLRSCRCWSWSWRRSGSSRTSSFASWTSWSRKEPCMCCSSASLWVRTPTIH